LAKFRLGPFIVLKIIIPCDFPTESSEYDFKLIRSANVRVFLITLPTFFLQQIYA
jgi:hypothetical protein